MSARHHSSVSTFLFLFFSFQPLSSAIVPQRLIIIIHPFYNFLHSSTLKKNFIHPSLSLPFSSLSSSKLATSSHNTPSATHPLHPFFHLHPHSPNFIHTFIIHTHLPFSCLSSSSQPATPLRDAPSPPHALHPPRYLAIQSGHPPSHRGALSLPIRVITAGEKDAQVND